MEDSTRKRSPGPRSWPTCCVGGHFVHLGKHVVDVWQRRILSQRRHRHGPTTFSGLGKYLYDEFLQSFFRFKPVLEVLYRLLQTLPGRRLYVLEWRLAAFPGLQNHPERMEYQQWLEDPVHCWPVWGCRPFFSL